jgi:hypothetical protein
MSYQAYTRMHNLKSNYDKFLPIVKESLKDYMLPDGNFQLYRNKPKLSDIEVVTLAVLAETLGVDSENHLFSKLKTEYFADFVNLPDRSNFNRRRRRLQHYVMIICDWVAKQIEKDDKVFVIDSMPLPICKPGRVFRSKVCKDDQHVQPARSYHAAHKVYYYGFKLQLIVSQQGIPITAGMTAANVHDVKYLGMLDFDEQLSNCELIGDKGYLSLGYQTTLFDEAKIKLITPLRSNMKTVISSWNEGYRYTRKRSETLFSQLGDQMMLTRNYAKSLDGLFSRIMYKLSAVAVLQWINFSNGKPINHIKHALAF